MAKPMSAKIAVISSVTWLIGWRRPASTGASRTGNDTSSVSEASRAARASAARASRRPASAAATRSFRRLRAAPLALRSSGLMRPSVAIRAETEPFLPSAATRTASSAASVSAAPTSARMDVSSSASSTMDVSLIPDGRAAPDGAARSSWPQTAAAGRAALAFSTMALKASGSEMARSDRTFRSSSMPALFSPSMKRL